MPARRERGAPEDADASADARGPAGLRELASSGAGALVRSAVWCDSASGSKRTCAVRFVRPLIVPSRSPERVYLVRSSCSEVPRTASWPPRAARTRSHQIPSSTSRRRTQRALLRNDVHARCVRTSVPPGGDVMRRQRSDDVGDTSRGASLTASTTARGRRDSFQQGYY